MGGVSLLRCHHPELVSEIVGRVLGGWVRSVRVGGVSLLRCHCPELVS